MVVSKLGCQALPVCEGGAVKRRCGAAVRAGGAVPVSLCSRGARGGHRHGAGHVGRLRGLREEAASFSFWKTTKAGTWEGQQQEGPRDKGTGKVSPANRLSSEPTTQAPHSAPASPGPLRLPRPPPRPSSQLLRAAGMAGWPGLGG